MKIAVTLLALLWSASVMCAGNDTQPTEPPVFEYILENREWFGTGMCPERVLLLQTEPPAGVTKTQMRQLKVALENDGCQVVDWTDAEFRRFVNPNKDEWRYDHLTGAITCGVEVKRDDPGEFSIRIGYYKGKLSAKSRTFFYLWDGSGWKEDTEKVVITVS